jgi:hypothetical protein
MGLGNILSSWPTLKSDFLFFKVKSDKPKTCSTRFRIWVGIGMHGNFIFKTVEISSRPRKNIVVVFSGHFVFGPPPSAVIIVDNGWNYKGPRAIFIIVDTMMNYGG